MRIPVEIDGVKKIIDVPDDSSQDEIDQIVNSEMGVGEEEATKPGIGSKILYGIGKAGEFVEEKIDKPFRKLIGIEKTLNEMSASGTKIPTEMLMAEPGLPTSNKSMLSEKPQAETDVGAASSEITKMIASPLNLLPGAGSKGVVKKVGEKTVGFGESLLKSGMKIKDSSAKLMGRNAEEGVKKVVSDITKYDVQSTKGGFSGIAQNARKKITENTDKADEVILNAAKADPTKTVDIDNIFLSFIDDIQKGKVETIFGWEDNGAEMASNIHKALEKRGLSGNQPISKLPEIKKTINKGMQLFKKGAQNLAGEPKQTMIGDLSYLKMKEALEDVVPEVAQYNKATHDLINIEKVSLEAKKGVGNNNKIGLVDAMLLFGGPGALQSLGVSPGIAASGSLVGAALIAKKLASGGRGSSAIISSGKGLKTSAPYIDKTAKGVYGASVLSKALRKKKEEDKKK
ncbi:MAG: hypothetical protein WC716_16475 [Chitinophagaceae bacterium]|jgi:hypothetical protein